MSYTTRNESAIIYNGIRLHMARAITREGFGAASREVTRTQYYLGNADGPCIGSTERHAKRDGSGKAWTVRATFHDVEGSGGRCDGIDVAFLLEGWPEAMAKEHTPCAACVDTGRIADDIPCSCPVGAALSPSTGN